MTKIIKTYSIDLETAEKIKALARSTRRSLSAVVDIAVEEYASGKLCPTCNFPMINTNDGIPWCSKCKMAIGNDGKEH